MSTPWTSVLEEAILQPGMLQAECCCIDYITTSMRNGRERGLSSELCCFLQQHSAMLSLHLREEEDDGGGAEPDGLRRIQGLERLQEPLQQVAAAGEGRVWLRSALAGLPVAPGSHAAAFENLLANTAAACRDGDADGVTVEPVARQVARLVCERQARGVARLLARGDGSLVRDFFAGQEGRIRRWFGAFAGGELGEHQLGARALARYAFVHRETCWEELEWQGKGSRAQAPATVAAKPHYFRELDVVRTVDNFIQRVPGFWSSDELWDSLRDGAFVALDTEFFAKELLWRMFNNNSSQAWELVREFLASESFLALARPVLPLVRDAELLMFVHDLGGASMWREEGRSARKSWLEQAMAAGVRWSSLDDLLVASACGCNARELRKLLMDEEHQEQAVLVKQALGSLMQMTAPDAVRQHWALRLDTARSRDWKAWKWLAMEAWVLYNELAEQKEPRVVETLLADIGVVYRTQEISTPDSDHQSKDAKKRHKKRKRPQASKTPAIVDDGIATSPCFRLSVDNFTMLWTKDDVDLFLAAYALEKWLSTIGQAADL